MNIICFALIIYLFSYFFNDNHVDERMQHMCQWEGHREHDNEKDCFYSPILAYVIIRCRLVSNSYIYR